MNEFDIILAPRAAKDLDGFTASDRRKITGALKTLGGNPFPRGKTVRKIKGKNDDFFRLRVDKHRVFYVIEHGKVVVLRVLSKKEAGRFIRKLE